MVAPFHTVLIPKSLSQSWGNQKQRKKRKRSAIALCLYTTVYYTPHRIATEILKLKVYNGYHLFLHPTTSVTVPTSVLAFLELCTKFLWSVTGRMAPHSGRTRQPRWFWKCSKLAPPQAQLSNGIVVGIVPSSRDRGAAKHWRVLLRSVSWNAHLPFAITVASRSSMLDAESAFSHCETSETKVEHKTTAGGDKAPFRRRMLLWRLCT